MCWHGTPHVIALTAPAVLPDFAPQGLCTCCSFYLECLLQRVLGLHLNQVYVNFPCLLRLETTQLYSLTVLAIRSLEWIVQAAFLLEAPGCNLFDGSLFQLLRAACSSGLTDLHHHDLCLCHLISPDSDPPCPLLCKQLPMTLLPSL